VVALNQFVKEFIEFFFRTPIKKTDTCQGHITCSKNPKRVYRNFISYKQPHVTLPTALCLWRTMTAYSSIRGSRWLRGLRRVFAAPCFLWLWVRISPGAWMSIMSAERCQVAVFAMGRSLVQWSPT